MRHISICTMLILGSMGLFLLGCSAKTVTVEDADDANVVAVPMPPQTVETSIPEKSSTSQQKLTTYEDSSSTVASAPSDAPQELRDLLHLKGKGRQESAVNKLRPAAIREAAQLVAVQTAMAWQYRQLVEETESYAAILDQAFNFTPLLMTQGDALIMPPVLTRAGASLRIEDDATATTAKATYEQLAPARYVATPPTWREFLMMDTFPEPESPSPAVLPQNSEERAVWQEAVQEGWAQGAMEARNLYQENLSRMSRQYRGIMLYHLLTAQHLLTQVNVATADRGAITTNSGTKLHIDQKVYRITRPASFAPANAVLAIDKKHRR